MKPYARDLPSRISAATNPLIPSGQKLTPTTIHAHHPPSTRTIIHSSHGADRRIGSSICPALPSVGRALRGAVVVPGRVPVRRTRLDGNALRRARRDQRCSVCRWCRPASDGGRRMTGTATTAFSNAQRIRPAERRIYPPSPADHYTLPAHRTGAGDGSAQPLQVHRIPLARETGLNNPSDGLRWC